jgi:maleylacetate reductase
VIVERGLATLRPLLENLGIERPFLIASDRWATLDLPAVGHWSEVPSDRIADLAAAAAGADGLLAVGGGSAIDLAKAVSVATRLPVVSIPTTYSGAEWTPMFGIRDHDRRMRGGGGGGANLAGIVYDVELTLDLPHDLSVGTALNALAHCAEALYVKGRNAEGDRYALEGARKIEDALPAVAADGRDRAARVELLEGADAAGHALALAGLGLGHAMAQAVGRYGLPHGALNAICLPAALRFNMPVASAAIERFAGALGTDDPEGRVRELARLGGHERLRDLGVPAGDLPALGAAAAERGGAKANPRPATSGEVEELLRSVW